HLPRADRAVRTGHPHGGAGVRQLHRRRRLRARHVRLRGSGGRPGQGVPRRAAAGEDGHRRGIRRRVARRRRDALAGLRALGLLRRGRARRDPPRPRHHGQDQLAQARAGPGAGDRAAVRPGRDPRHRLRRREGAVRPARDPGPRGRRLGVRRVQAAVRHLAGHRLGPAARLPGRGAGQPPGRAVQRGGQEGQRVHPAGQLHRHAAGVPPEHDRVHGRRPLRAGRHHQGRREDDQRGDQLGRPAPDRQQGVLVRRGQLRHVRAGLRPAPDVRLARSQARRDGRDPAGRGDVHRRPGLGRVHRPAVRRGGGSAAHRRDRGPDRGRVALLLRHRPALRRRHHRPARHQDRPRPGPVGRAQRPRDRPPRLRRLPDVTAVTQTIAKLLVANRGEIAARIIRSAHALGIATVAVYSDPDADAPYVTLADEAVRLPGAAPAETYLRGDLIVAAAAATGAGAVHPGYGFLSENAAFARACGDAGLVFVGPRPETIEAMGDKVKAKATMAAAGVPVLPSATITFTTDPTTAAAKVGFPLLVKAAFGGGGRGMRLVTDPGELSEAVSTARSEAASAFGDGTVFLERYVTDPRHVEVQILGDAAGTVIHLFERECSIQRRYQKIVEECPSPAVGDDLRDALTAAAEAAGQAVGYTGAGTVEFVLDRGGSFWFLEMNTRLQVEHPVTEEVTGLDLVELQLRLAEGEPLPPQAREARIGGHAIEVRLYAEDVAAGFVPATGPLHRFEIPEAPGIRVDTGFRSGSVVSPHYDAMLAKVIAHGRTRADAARRLARALSQAEIHGVTTNRDLLTAILREPEFLAGGTDTGYLTRHEPAALAAAAAPAADSVRVHA